MTKEQLEAIRERVQTAKEFAERCPSIRPTPDHGRAIADRAALLEEVDRLRTAMGQIAELDPYICASTFEGGYWCQFCDTKDETHRSGCLWLAAQTDPA